MMAIEVMGFSPREPRSGVARNEVAMIPAKRVDQEAFRAVTPEFLAATLAGRFRLRRLSYYRSDLSSDGRADALENAVQVHSGHHVLRGDDDNRRIEEALKSRMRISVHAYGEAIISNNIVRTFGIDPLVLCCSLGRPMVLTTDDRGVWVRIADVHELARRLQKRHPELGSFRVAPVKYVRREFGLTGGLSGPDPFKKSRRFKKEREIRLAFEGMDVGEHFDTDCPECSELMRRV